MQIFFDDLKIHRVKRTMFEKILTCITEFKLHSYGDCNPVLFQMTGTYQLNQMLSMKIVWYLLNFQYAKTSDVSPGNSIINYDAYICRLQRNFHLIRPIFSLFQIHPTNMKIKLIDTHIASLIDVKIQCSVPLKAHECFLSFDPLFRCMPERTSLS